MKVHVATSRKIGEVCRGYVDNASMDECDIFVSVLYDKIIPEEYIKSRPCFNFHPGILPQYRGSGAYSWAIINKEFETGVTLHKIDKDIDHGDIIEIRRFPIEPHDTAGTLFRKAENTILEMFKEWLPKLISGEYTLYEPPRVEKIYYRKDLEKAKDLTHYIKAFTFEGKEEAYWIDSKGKKHYLGKWS